MFAIATPIDARKIVDRCAHKREAWWRRMRTASSDLRVRFQEAGLPVPLLLRVDLREADRERRAERVQDLLHRGFDPLERVHVDLRLFHRDLDSLRRMRRARLR